MNWMGADDSSPLPFRGMAAITSKWLNEWGPRKHMQDKQVVRETKMGPVQKDNSQQKKRRTKLELIKINRKLGIYWQSSCHDDLYERAVFLMHSSLESFVLFHSPTPDEFAASGAFFEYFFCCAPISKGRGCRLSCGSNCELIPFLFWGFVPSFCGWEASSSAPPLLTSTSIKKPFPLNIIIINKNRACLRTGGIAQSYLSLK